MTTSAKSPFRWMLHIAALSAILALPAVGPSEAGSGQKPTPLPKGVPGFFDPDTGIFTPLDETAPPASRADTITGLINIGIDYDFLQKYPTVSCIIIVEFGNQTGGGFFPNHAVSTDTFTFSAANPIKAAPIPFAYTPNGNGTPSLEVALECDAFDNAGVEHEAKYLSPLMPAQSGTTNVSAYDDE